MKEVISPDLHGEGNPAHEQSITAACAQKTIANMKETKLCIGPLGRPRCGGLGGGAEEIVQLTKDLSCDMIPSTHVKT